MHEFEKKKGSIIFKKAKTKYSKSILRVLVTTYCEVVGVAPSISRW